jgi:hypothetical protein
MSRRVHGKAVHHRLDWEVFELPEQGSRIALESLLDEAGHPERRARPTRDLLLVRAALYQPGGGARA